MREFSRSRASCSLETMMVRIVLAWESMIWIRWEVLGLGISAPSWRLK